MKSNVLFLSLAGFQVDPDGMGQSVIMEEFILPDTDVLVDFFRGHPKGVAFVNIHASRIILSIHP
jgi:hypothetical protein